MRPLDTENQPVLQLVPQPCYAHRNSDAGRLKMVDLPYSLKEDDVMLSCIANTPAIYNQSHADYKNYLLKEEEWAKIAKKINRTTVSCKKRWRTIRDNYYKQRKFNKTPSRPCGRKYPLASKLKFLDLQRKGSNHTIDNVSHDLSEGSDNFDDIDEASSNFLEIVRDDIKEDDVDQHMKSNNSDEIQFEPNTPSFKFLDAGDPFDPLSGSNTNKTNFMTLLTKLIDKRDKEFDMMIKYITDANQAKELDDIDLFFKSMAMTVKNFSQENIAKVKLKVCQTIMEMELENK